MKDCINDAYAYYHNPLYKECEKEFSSLPLVFGRKKKEKAIREKYKQKGLKVIRYEDFLWSDGELEFALRRTESMCNFCGNRSLYLRYRRFFSRKL